MPSKIAAFPVQSVSSHQFTQHNASSATPGLPVKAAEIIFQGCMVAFDPANSQAQSADPAMPVTAVVVGVNKTDNVDNLTGAKGAKLVNPVGGTYRFKNDGNLTSAHLYTFVRVVDDHTVGVPAGNNTDRRAGVLIGLDSTYAWVAIDPVRNAI
jgi:hypothetical protein